MKKVTQTHPLSPSRYANSAIRRSYTPAAPSKSEHHARIAEKLNKKSQKKESLLRERFENDLCKKTKIPIELIKIITIDNKFPISKIEKIYSQYNNLFNQSV